MLKLSHDIEHNFNIDELEKYRNVFYPNVKVITMVTTDCKGRTSTEIIRPKDSLTLGSCQRFAQPTHNVFKYRFNGRRFSAVPVDKYDKEDVLKVLRKRTPI